MQHSIWKQLVGTKVAIVATGLIVMAGAGVAGAAAADLGPWLSDAPEATSPPVTTAATTTTAPEPATTEPVATAAPATEPTLAEPPATEPPATTGPRQETKVPQGIELACNVVDQVQVHCEWHGGVVDGFSRYLVLRNDGRVVFGTEDPDIHTYTDQPGKAGTFSYVVISVDGNDKNLSHSNAVSVQVGTPA